MRRPFEVAAIFIGLANSAVGAPAVYDCKVNQSQDDRGWIGDQYVFAIDDASGGVVVDDMAIEYFNKGPIAAKVINSDSAKIDFSWGIFAVDGSGARAKISYRATLFFADSTFLVHGKTNPYKVSFEGRGTCNKVN